MAQFSHADFGAMSQWLRGMTMVGDNNDLKSKTRRDLRGARVAHRQSGFQTVGEDRRDVEISYRSAGHDVLRLGCRTLRPLTRRRH